MSSEPTDQELSRADKLARIAALGIDPWGQRFDGHKPIAEVRKLPAVPLDQSQHRARAASSGGSPCNV